MNNLKLSWELSSQLQLQSEDEVLRFSALDIERNRLFFASSTNLIYTTHLSSLLQQNDAEWSKSLLSSTGESIDLEPGDLITCMDYLMEKEALIIGTSYGLLLLYTVDDNTTEIVGKIEGGVKCISPSPDGDLLAVITGFGQILVMTPDWDVLYEISLNDQPHDIDACESTLSSESPISWKGDGKYFATLSEVQDSSSPLLKKLKIWERDSGALHSVSDPKALIGGVLDWMPSGAKIATVYDRREENQCPSIVFFERNGLERSSFSIDDERSDVSIDTLKWNCSSDLLATIVRGASYDSLKMWFFSNNHWYLKFETRYPKKDGVKYMWDPIKPLQLISWTLTGQITIRNSIWVTAVSENSTALVIDGSKILITPLSQSIIPPPIYLFNLTFPSAVQNIAFCSKGTKNHVAASLSDGRLCVTELPPLDTWEDLEGKEFNIEACTSNTEFGCFVYLAWLNSHVLVGVSNKQALQEIEVECCEDLIPGSVTCSSWNAKISNQISLERLVIGLVPNRFYGNSVYIQFEGGKIAEYVSKLGLQNCESMCFSSSCPWMDLALVEFCGTQNALLFGLDENNVLHVNEKILCNNCTSFSLYSNLGDQFTTHLVISTKQDLLFVVDISDIQDGDVTSKYENFLPVFKRRGGEDERVYVNIWERGAKIVGVIHGDESAVLLQAPRGNLECIYPRKLVIASIVNALIQRRFEDALLMVRRQRIDFNIIIDYCGWQAFVQFATEFVKQVKNLSYITEFVCCIKNENILGTLYKKYVSSMPPFLTLENGGDSKVSSVLLAIRKALEEEVIESPARELCILTTLARSNPPALEEALQRIKIVREMELRNCDDPKRVRYPCAEESLKHLLWLSDSEAVFEAALGLYDLNLSAMVALNSQKDPKEFLPFLQQLQSMPGVIMQYNIDLKLHRYENALRHIVSAGDAYYEDCMNLLKNNPHLFPLGLQLINDHPEKRKQVLEAWGDHLSLTKSFEEAATTYLSCFCLEKALKAYRASGNWSGVLSVAGLIKLGKEEIVELAHELCEELEALGKPVDAAKIALEYCGDVNAGVNLLISAREWEEALRIAFLYRRDDLIEQVKIASLDCANMVMAENEEGLEKVGKYLARYLAVRQRRLLLAAKLKLEEERSINDLDDDTASESSSNFSGMSAYTRGTRKSSAASVSSTSTKARDLRRERKKGNIRAGSPGEELGLVDHLKGMCVGSGTKSEVKKLLICLVMMGKEEIARKLQRVCESFQLSQMAAVNLAEDAMSTDIVDERAYTLDQYLHKIRQQQNYSHSFSWQLKVLI